ncbi:hypothetical protein CKAH01_17481 [Colletotrichum kahawae]|uniref:Uncharacterized protein n=1 Tax=Colletotrichum kahawae TaxID=34407 RepID=A0AAD9YBR6_COLKA|nr:hypothetical protein CKAH01_17481 [Colletotrichum kahawae]
MFLTQRRGLLRGLSSSCSPACIGASHYNGPETIHTVEGPEAMEMPSGPSTSPARASLLTPSSDTSARCDTN